MRAWRLGAAPLSMTPISRARSSSSSLVLSCSSAMFIFHSGGVWESAGLRGGWAGIGAARGMVDGRWAESPKMRKCAWGLEGPALSARRPRGV